MDVHRVFGDVVAEVVGFSVISAAFDSGTGHPFGVTSWMVVATVICFGQTALTVNGPSKFSAPDHQRVVQHAALFQILHQCVTRLVDDAALATNVVGKVAVLIPLADKHLSESHAAFGHAAGQQAICREGPRLGNVGTIHFQSFF